MNSRHCQSRIDSRVKAVLLRLGPLAVLFAIVGIVLGFALNWDNHSYQGPHINRIGKGMNRYDDAHFKQWPFPVSDAEIRTEGFLKSLTAPEELAIFLSLRGNCLKATGHVAAAAECYANASHLAPGWNAYRALLADANGTGISARVVSQYIASPQTQGSANLGGLGLPPVGPDPNPLKQMNGR